MTFLMSHWLRKCMEFCALASWLHSGFGCDVETDASPMP